MNKKIFISFGLLVLLAAAAALINFDRSVEAAYLPGPSSQWTTSGSHIYFEGANVGIGNLPSPTEKLDVVGNVKATSFIYSSDARLKSEVAVLTGALDKVMALEGVSFSWLANGEAEIGLIAQDVEKVVPELVVTGSDGLKSVKYGNIVALLIEAVQEQQAEIDSLRSELEKLVK